MFWTARGVSLPVWEEGSNHPPDSELQPAPVPISTASLAAKHFRGNPGQFPGKGLLQGFMLEMPQLCCPRTELQPWSSCSGLWFPKVVAGTGRGTAPRARIVQGIGAGSLCILSCVPCVSYTANRKLLEQLLFVRSKEIRSDFHVPSTQIWKSGLLNDKLLQSSHDLMGKS